ncbi:MAG TPA: hypothetical protein PK668_07135 [Myxococcota bacterium]|nr:hypothetical protein [Myxococcota bacterium]HRY92381.1 hypothetical protein [Myxococcota bacterium]
MRFKSSIVLFLALAGLSGCAEERAGVPIPLGGFQYPVGLAVHPAGFALVSCSNFDLAFAGGSLRVIDLLGLSQADLASPDPDDPYFTRFILDDQAVRLDNFAGSVVLSEDGSVAAVAVRESNQVVLLEVSVDPAGGGLVLNCWPDGRRPERDFPRCEGVRHLITLLEPDPFSLLLVEGEESRTLVVGALRGDNLLGYDLPKASNGLNQEAFSFETPETGYNDLAYSAASGLVYVTVRYPMTYSNPLLMLDPALGAAAGLARTDFFRQLLGNETRSLTFFQGGERAGLVMRNPDVLAILDTSLDEVGQPRNAYLDALVVGGNPSRVRAHGDLLLVTGSMDDAVYAIDGSSRRMLGFREGVCKGPFDIGFYDPPGGGAWALLTCFDDNQVIVLDADPASGGFMDVLARVGRPTEEQR